MEGKRNDKLQSLCRHYLNSLRDTAKELGLLPWVDKTIDDNMNNRCSGTEEQCEMLARMCDDERVHRKNVPKIIGKSYRQAYEDGDFEKIKTIRNNGIYSKVSALLFKEKE